MLFYRRLRSTGEKRFFPFLIFWKSPSDVRSNALRFDCPLINSTKATSRSRTTLNSNPHSPPTAAAEETLIKVYATNQHARRAIYAGKREPSIAEKSAGGLGHFSDNFTVIVAPVWNRKWILSAFALVNHLNRTANRQPFRALCQRLRRLSMLEKMLSLGVRDNEIRQAINFIERNKSAKGDWRRIN